MEYVCDTIGIREFLWVVWLVVDLHFCANGGTVNAECPVPGCALRVKYSTLGARARASGGTYSTVGGARFRVRAGDTS